MTPEVLEELKKSAEELVRINAFFETYEEELQQVAFDVIFSISHLHKDNPITYLKGYLANEEAFKVYQFRVMSPDSCRSLSLEYRESGIYVSWEYYCGGDYEDDGAYLPWEVFEDPKKSLTDYKKYLEELHIVLKARELEVINFEAARKTAAAQASAEFLEIQERRELERLKAKYGVI